MVVVVATVAVSAAVVAVAVVGVTVAVVAVSMKIVLNCSGDSSSSIRGRVEAGSFSNSGR